MNAPIKLMLLALLTAFSVNAQNNWEYIDGGTYIEPVKYLEDVNGFQFNITTEMPGIGELWKAPVGTDNWEQVTLPYQYYAYGLAQDDQGGLYITIGQKLFKTTDNGATWTDLNFDVDFRANCNCGFDPYFCSIAGLSAVWFDDQDRLMTQSQASWRWASCTRHYRINENQVAKWYNLQYPYNGTVALNESFRVYGQIWVDGLTAAEGQAEGIRAWVGRSAYNVHPSMGPFVWTEAEFNGDRDNNDEYKADITFPDSGTYYVATRYQIGDGQYLYGGLGGPWEEGVNPTIEVQVTAISVDWGNVQWPINGTYELGESVNVYAQAWMNGMTAAEGPAGDLKCWIAWRPASELPWNYEFEWIRASFHGDRGNNDEFKITLTPEQLASAGDYQIMSKFQYGNGPVLYCGVDGPYTDYAYININGVDPVNIGWCNLQWPGNATIFGESSTTFYAQVWANDVTANDGADEAIQAWIGYNDSPVGPNADGWTWLPANYNGQRGNNDEYKVSISGLAPQRYYVLSRFDGGNGNFVYGGFSQTNGHFYGQNGASHAILDVYDAPLAEEAPAPVWSAMDVQMEPAFPNPMKQQSTVNVKIPAETTGAVVVYDLLGHQILEIPLSSGGYHQVELDGAQINNSGLHLVGIQVQGQLIATQTIQVIK